MQVARCDTFDGQSFYFRDPDEHRIREFFRRFMDEPGRRELAEQAAKEGRLNTVTILDMSEDEYYSIPATNDSYKYLGAEGDTQ